MFGHGTTGMLGEGEHKQPQGKEQWVDHAN